MVSFKPENPKSAVRSRFVQRRSRPPSSGDENMGRLPFQEVRRALTPLLICKAATPPQRNLARPLCSSDLSRHCNNCEQVRCFAPVVVVVEIRFSLMLGFAVGFFRGGVCGCGAV